MEHHQVENEVAQPIVESAEVANENNAGASNMSPTEVGTGSASAATDIKHKLPESRVLLPLKLDPPVFLSVPPSEQRLRRALSPSARRKIIRLSHEKPNSSSSQQIGAMSYRQYRAELSQKIAADKVKKRPAKKVTVSVEEQDTNAAASSSSSSLRTKNLKIELEGLFHACDRDHDGYLQKDELLECLQMAGFILMPDNKLLGKFIPINHTAPLSAAASAAAGGGKGKSPAGASSRRPSLTTPGAGERRPSLTARRPSLSSPAAPMPPPPPTIPGRAKVSLSHFMRVALEELGVKAAAGGAGAADGSVAPTSPSAAVAAAAAASASATATAGKVSSSAVSNFDNLMKDVALLLCDDSASVRGTGASSNAAMGHDDEVSLRSIRHFLTEVESPAMLTKHQYTMLLRVIGVLKDGANAGAGTGAGAGGTGAAGSKSSLLLATRESEFGLPYEDFIQALLLHQHL